MGLLARRNPFHDKVRKKNVRTDAPTEHGDTKILGTVVYRRRSDMPIYSHITIVFMLSIAHI